MVGQIPLTAEPAISRAKRYIADLDITTSLNTTPAIDFRGAAAVALYVPSGAATSMTVCGLVGGTTTYAPLLTSAGAVVTFSVSAGTMAILPDEVYAQEYIKLVSSGANAPDCVLMVAT